MILEGTLEVGDLIKYINGYKVEESLYTKDGKQIYMRNLRLFLMKSQKGAEKKQAILDILIENPTITQTQLMEIMNLTRKQLQKDMKELQEEGVLIREGTNRTGRWEVKEYEE